MIKTLLHTLLLATLAQFAMANPNYVIDEVRRHNAILDSMPLGNYEEANTRRTEYAHEWYAYEEEYAYNFCGLE